MILMLLAPNGASYAQDLLETYRLAQINDPDHRIAEFNRLATNEGKSQSIAQMLPQMTASIQSIRTRFVATKLFYLGSGSLHYWDHAFELNINQPVFNWSHWIQLDQAKIKLAESEAQERARNQALITRTVTSYFDVLLAQDKLEYSEAERKSIEQQLEQAKARFNVGLTALPDVYEAQAGYDRSVANVLEAEKQLDNAKEKLHELIGTIPEKLNPLRAELPVAQEEAFDLSEWLNQAETHNATIAAQLNKTKYAEKNVDLQISKHYPTLDLTAEFRIVDSNNPFGLRGDTFAFGLLLNIPLFEGGATLSHTRQAKYEYESEKEELIKAKRAVQRTMTEAYNGLLANSSKVHAMKAATQSAETAFVAAEIGLNSGLRDMIDVLIQQSNLYKAKFDYSKSCYDYLISNIKLKEAAGELTENDLQFINTYLVKNSNSVSSTPIDSNQTETE
ncbi:MAG: TolC family outer membrane protein [Gammaproteobacteria bacterium]